MRPVYEMLRAASARISGHMPGHKGKAPFGAENLFALDTTELPVTDDLYAPERGLLEAQKLYARAAGAGASLLLHNGSTAGIHAMLQCWAREGDTVLLPRNAHLSAVNACVLGGLRVQWIPVRQRADGYCHIAGADVLAAMEQHPEAKALLLTRPDFFGCCLPLEAIVSKARAMQIRVVVDEAHGAHLPWLDAVDSAGALGADAWVQSVHKTLPGLTGAAVLHVRDASDAPRMLRILRREQTSSPSFVLLMSIDDARAYMEETGAEQLRRVGEAADALRRRLPSLGYADAHQQWQETGLHFDPTRLVIDAPQGGFALARELQAQGIDVEMADFHRVVLILTAMTGPEELRRVEDALRTIRPEAAKRPTLPALLSIPPRRMEVRPASMAEVEGVPLRQAAGRIAAAAAGLYPPGIPLVCPGEIITEELTALLAGVEAQQRFGVEGECLTCVMENA